MNISDTTQISLLIDMSYNIYKSYSYSGRFQLIIINNEEDNIISKYHYIGTISTCPWKMSNPERINFWTADIDALCK